MLLLLFAQDGSAPFPAAVQPHLLKLNAQKRNRLRYATGVLPKMYVGSDFQASDTGENESYTFDFVNDCASGETISAAVWTCEVVLGTDALASSRLSGSPVNSGTRTSQRLSGLLDGVTYRLRALVTTSAGNTLSLYSHVSAQAPA